MRVIRSPVTQAYEQALSLKAFLEKKVRQKGFFDRVERDVIVAVPDTEAIRWPRSGAQIEVCSADAVPRLAEFLVPKHRAHLVRLQQEGVREGIFGG